MSIQEQINIDIIKSMKNKESKKLEALRAAKSAILLECSKDGREKVDDEKAIKIITKLVKQRKDASEIYINQKRNDLAQIEINQLTVLQTYMPKQIDNNQLEIIVREVVQELNAKSQKDFGKCISILIKKLNGQADGKLISEFLKKELN
tara:strand:- start:1306 stop:1752 length:447 start_codon:yes stop_codon:yes gene_type:complete